MTVSPLDGKLYVSDHRTLRIVRVKTMGPVRDLTRNYEVVAGNGQQCVPGDIHRCGDGSPAIHAKLFYPKGRHFCCFGYICNHDVLYLLFYQSAAKFFVQLHLLQDVVSRLVH